jgi:hypothetical protein
MKIGAVDLQDEEDTNQARTIRGSVAMARENSEGLGMVLGARDPVDLSAVLAVAVVADSIVASVKGEGVSSMRAM